MAVKIGCCGFPVAQSRYACPIAGEFRYFRLHGRTGNRYRYREADLRRLAEMCRGRRSNYVLFNNLSMWEDARRFEQLWRRRH